MPLLEKFLENKSIRQKLIYSNVLSISLAVFIIASIMLIHQYISIKHAIFQEIHTQTDIVRDASAAAVAFEDARTAEETLAILKSASNILEAHLLLPDGTVLASYFKDSTVNPARNFHRKHNNATVEEISLTTIAISKPLLLRENPIGTICVIGSLESFYLRLGWYLITALAATGVAFLLARLLAKRISKSITQPIDHLIAITRHITTNNDYATQFHVTTNDEVGHLSQAFGEMVTEIKKRDLSLQQLAYYDRVTGLPNRHCFEEHITQAIENGERYGTHCALMMIDLDDFKLVNDTLGHTMGDLLLRIVGEKIKNTLRDSDNVFRIGGDEFAILVENLDKSPAMANVAKKIIHAVSQPIPLGETSVCVGASIGISYYPALANSKSTLISTADAAMYVAKTQGKNNYKIYTCT
ncbi:MAG: diguanylate cyclase [Campylobacterales bacterium]|nr:diguanylate cyclase [Campylobacterales bacterium]